MRQKQLIEYLQRGWELHICEPTHEGDTWTCQVSARHDGEEGKDGSDPDGLDGIFISLRQAEALTGKPQMRLAWRPNIYATVWRWSEGHLLAAT